MCKETREFLAKKEDELIPIAKELKESDYSNIVLLKGDLGAGKTAFVKAFCKNIDCSDQVSSPTFSLVNEYMCADEKIYHIDLYRLESVDEALDIGIEEYIYSTGYCFIEWPDIIQGLLPDRYIEVCITSTEENSRKLLISFK